MRVTSKGQVTIPQDVRLALGIDPGTDVTFAIDGDGARLVVDRLPVAAAIARARGSATTDLSTDEILALTRR